VVVVMVVMMVMMVMMVMVMVMVAAVVASVKGEKACTLSHCRSYEARSLFAWRKQKEE
jgi:uncharacterized protein YpuA (DUF1002 family)